MLPWEALLSSSPPVRDQKETVTSVRGLRICANPMAFGQAGHLDRLQPTGVQAKNPLFPDGASHGASTSMTRRFERLRIVLRATVVRSAG